MTDFFLHLWRLLLAVLVHRDAVPEQDVADPPVSGTIETPRLALAPPPGTNPPVTSPAAPAAPATEADDDTPVEPEPISGPALPALAIRADGWLVGDKVVHVPSVRGQRWHTKSGGPWGVLWHWTATGHGTALAMARRIAKKAGPGMKATSVHLWVEADGTIYQSIPFTRGSSHAGAPSATRFMDLDRDNWVADHRGPPHGYSANSLLIGVEIVCVGEVRLVNGKWMGWPFGKGRNGPIVSASEVKEGVDEHGRRRSYQDFTRGQRDACERLVRACHVTYGHTAQQLSWGHVTVDPTRKTDPGPLWLDGYLPDMLARQLTEG